MAALSDEPVVVIIDALPLRSLNLINILTHLDCSTSGGQFRLTLHTPDEMEQCIDPGANCEMLIYNVGSASLADRETLQRLEAFTMLAPDVPLVIISDSECREEIISALNIGAQGFVYAGTDAKVALQAFSFILNDDHIIQELCGQNSVIQNRRHGRSIAVLYPFSNWTKLNALRKICETKVKTATI